MGHHRRVHGQFPPFFSLLHCPLRLGELQACQFPDVVFPPLRLSALSSFDSACRMVLARPDEREAYLYHFSLRVFTIVKRSSRSSIACWILARTSSLVTWSLDEIHRILRKHLISMSCILCSSAVRVHDSILHRYHGLIKES